MTSRAASSMFVASRLSVNSPLFKASALASSKQPCVDKGIYVYVGMHSGGQDSAKQVLKIFVVASFHAC